MAGLLSVAVLLSCTTSRAEVRPSSVSHPAVSPVPSAGAPPSFARPLSVTTPPPGTLIAPGATQVAGEVAGLLPARLPAPSGLSPASALIELQMNLCNSGEAGCYTGGRSVDEARALMRGAARPDLVTLNEVCRGDVTDRLGRVMTDLWPYDDIVYLFAPALNAAGGPYRCQNGDDFGNGLLARVPAGQLTVLDTRYGVYAEQATDIERRTFGCVLLAPRYAACLTHLENVSSTVALAQCRTLMSRVVPTLRRDWGEATPVIVAGDMNLAGGVSRCVPADFRQVDDGAVQHVLGSAGVQFPHVDRYPMKRTDHDALAVTVTLP